MSRGADFVSSLSYLELLVLNAIKAPAKLDRL